MKLELKRIRIDRRSKFELEARRDSISNHLPCDYTKNSSIFEKFWKCYGIRKYIFMCSSFINKKFIYICKTFAKNSRKIYSLCILYYQVSQARVRHMQLASNYISYVEFQLAAQLSWCSPQEGNLVQSMVR